MARERFTLYGAGDARALAHREALADLVPIADVYGRANVYATNAAGAVVPIPPTPAPLPAPLPAFTDAARALLAADRTVDALERKLSAARAVASHALANYRRELDRERSRDRTGV